jgi:hypothetical protein
VRADIKENNMKIGKLIKSNIASIINYCNNVNHDEFGSLCDLPYSKRIFDINFPFFIEISNINENDSKKQSCRFWSEIYLVRGKRVRITSQWFESSIPLFLKYMEQKDIAVNSKIDSSAIEKTVVNSRVNSRYRGNAIGNAQNLLIRNILSNLGTESFSEENWKETKNYFNNVCAYCGGGTEFFIEHAIPINKVKLGEHRLGNIIPSCKKCNSNKADKDYKEFLGDNVEAIARIEKYMESRNYVPLEDNEQMKKILNIAYDEVASVANRYITIINLLFISE